LSARERLARAQEQLVRALAVGGPLPGGFSAGRLEAAARALLNKRRRQVQRSWPTLAAALGEDFAPRFEAWARQHPLPVEANPLADGRLFAESLREAGQLPPQAAGEVRAFDRHWRLTAEGELAQRWRWWATLKALLPGRRGPR
jgi:hypothetical protein